MSDVAPFGTTISVSLCAPPAIEAVRRPALAISDVVAAAVTLASRFSRDSDTGLPPVISGDAATSTPRIEAVTLTGEVLRGIGASGSKSRAALLLQTLISQT